MSWRIILITKPCKLFCKDNQLIYKPVDEDEIKVPLKDISTIVIDTKQINITSYLLSEIAKYGITILTTTNENHMPNGIFLPYMSYYKNSETAFLQQEWSESFKKKLWKKIIQAKIENQALAIKNINKDMYVMLNNLSKKVLSGDTTNIEGVSANFYFKTLYENFNRHTNTKVNTALNYAYSIVRSLLAKNLSAIGFINCFGLHHCNKLNQFNLVDDMIEPFRGIIDYNVKKLYNIDNDDDNLTTEEKAELIKIMFYEVSYDNKNYSIVYTTQLVAENLLNITKFNSPNSLITPTFKTEYLNE